MEDSFKQQRKFVQTTTYSPYRALISCLLLCKNTPTEHGSSRGYPQVLALRTIFMCENSTKTTCLSSAKGSGTRVSTVFIWMKGYSHLALCGNRHMGILMLLSSVFVLATCNFVDAIGLYKQCNPKGPSIQARAQLKVQIYPPPHRKRKSVLVQNFLFFWLDELFFEGGFY